jgi:hypothetical protein
MNKNVLRRIASLQLQGKDGYDQDFLAILANDAETLLKWSAPLTEEERTERNNAIFDHWLAGETTRELSGITQLDHSTIVDIVKMVGDIRLRGYHQIEKPPTCPPYNVWIYNSCDPRFGQKHPGQIPGQAIVKEK